MSADPTKIIAALVIVLIRNWLQPSGFTPSGIVDLRTGEIGDHRPDAWHTRITGVGYDPYGDCPRWREFLDTTFEGDHELIAYELLASR